MASGAAHSRPYASAKTHTKPRLRRRVDVCGSGNSLRCSRLCRGARSRLKISLLVCYCASWVLAFASTVGGHSARSAGRDSWNEAQPSQSSHLYAIAAATARSGQSLKPQLPSLLLAATPQNRRATAIRHRRDSSTALSYTPSLRRRETKRCRASRT